MVSSSENNWEGTRLNMKNILWISPFAPYDKVNHAGGQTENFYVKGLKRAGYDIRVLSFCTEDELEKIDLDEYGIENDIILLKRDRISKIIRTFKYNIIDSKYNPFNKYGNLVSNNFIKCVLASVKSYKHDSYHPNVIVLEWTESALLTKKIKSVFSDSKIICIEEDVAYLGYKRHYEYAQSKFAKWKWNTKYRNLKKQELLALSIADFVCCLNEKDSKLLVKDGIDEKKISNWTPFFKHYDYVKRNTSKGCKLLFFGNMAREENYVSVIWFIEKVIPLLKQISFEFNIVGAKPPEFLYKYNSNNIHIVGFVDDVTPYFEECTCLVAPLQLGAGIKIKILEAMSAGIPVLTNEIGIEGIPAKDRKDYIFCKEPNDYVNAIESLINDQHLLGVFENNSKEFIRGHYNLEESLQIFYKLIDRI